MKRNGLVLTALAVAMLGSSAMGKTDKATSQVAAKEAATKPAAREVQLSGIYEEMAKELKLSDEQAAKLSEKIEAKKTALAQWDQDNKQALEEMTKAAKEARESGDAEGRDKIRLQEKELSSRRAKLAAAAEEDIMGVLTDRQKTDWKAYQLCKVTLNKFRKAELSDEQKAQVRRLARERVNETDGEKVSERAMQAGLEKKVRELLTDEQKARMPGAAKSKPASKPATKAAESAAGSVK